MGLIAAIGVKIPQVWSSAPAWRKNSAVIGSEGMPDTPVGVAPTAAHLDIRGFTADPNFLQVKVPIAFQTIVYEFHPREVIQMPMLAGHQETGGNGYGRLALCRTVVHIACLVGAVCLHLGCK